MSTQLVIQGRESVFDAYAGTYRDVIDRAVKLSGEQFEFFINLRVSMMSARVGRYCPDFKAGTILDFGCGIGVTEFYICAHFPKKASLRAQIDTRGSLSMLRALMAPERVEMSMRPSSSTAWTTGESWGRPSRRRVASTDLWFCLKCSSAKSISISLLPI